MKLGFCLAVVLAGLLAAGCFLNVSSYRDDDGSLVYVGEVTNDGAPLIGAEVTGTFFDAAGNVITTATGDVCRVMPTKSIAAFKVTLPPGTPDPARVEWALNGQPVDDAYLADGLTAELFGTGPPQLPPNGTSHYGEMRNNSANEYRGGSVCAAWTNAKGEVIRVATAEAAGFDFGPGDVLPFKLQQDLPPEVTEVVLFLDAGVVPPPNTPPTVMKLGSASFENAIRRAVPGPAGATLFLGLGEIHNDGANPLSINMSAVVRDSSRHPIGVSSGQGFCRVPALPGGFTYGGYIMVSDASASAPVELNIEAIEVPAGNLSVLPVSNMSNSGSPSLGERVKATVRNDSGETLQLVHVCAAVYDADGDVIGALPAVADLPQGGLLPNRSVTVTVDVPTFGEPESANMIAAGSP